jgi:hypothetical protein
LKEAEIDIASELSAIDDDHERRVAPPFQAVAMTDEVKRE